MKSRSKATHLASISEQELPEESFYIDKISAGGQAGTITVSGAIGASSGWTSANTLTLNAASTITISAAITGANGKLILNPGPSSAVSIGSAINVNTLTINGTGAVT